MSNPIPRYSEGNKVEFTDKVSIWLNRAAGFFSKDARPVTPPDFAVAVKDNALLLTWTPDLRADFYNVYVSSTNDVNSKLLLERLYGDASSFVHYLGGAATRYYWLEANTNTGRVGELVQSSGTSTAPSAPDPGVTLISETIVGGGGASTVTFSSIPGSYRHLIVYYVCRSDNATLRDLGLRFNGDTGGNYRSQVITANNATAANVAVVAQTEILVGRVSPSGAPADSMHSGEIKIPYYATTTQMKSAIGTFVGETSSADSGQYAGIEAGRWVTPNAAITSIVLFPVGAGSFVQNSRFSLYGIN